MSKNEKRDRTGRSLRRCARARVAPATALSFKPRVPLEGEGVRQSRACERDASRAPSEPSGSLAETGPFSFLVIIEIGSQVLLLSRGAPLALITRCHAGLYTRMLSFKLARSISTPVMEWIFNVQWY